MTITSSASALNIQSLIQQCDAVTEYKRHVESLMSNAGMTAEPPRRLLSSNSPPLLPSLGPMLSPGRKNSTTHAEAPGSSRLRASNLAASQGAQPMIMSTSMDAPSVVSLSLGAALRTSSRGGVAARSSRLSRLSITRPEEEDPPRNDPSPPHLSASVPGIPRGAASGPLLRSRKASNPSFRGISIPYAVPETGTDAAAAAPRSSTVNGPSLGPAAPAPRKQRTSLTAWTGELPLLGASVAAQDDLSRLAAAIVANPADVTLFPNNHAGVGGGMVKQHAFSAPQYRAASQMDPTASIARLTRGSVTGLTGGGPDASAYAVGSSRTSRGMGSMLLAQNTVSAEALKSRWTIGKEVTVKEEPTGCFGWLFRARDRRCGSL